MVLVGEAGRVGLGEEPGEEPGGGVVQDEGEARGEGGCSKVAQGGPFEGARAAVVAASSRTCPCLWFGGARGASAAATRKQGRHGYSRSLGFSKWQF